MTNLSRNNRNYVPIIFLIIVYFFTLQTSQEISIDTYLYLNLLNVYDLKSYFIQRKSNLIYDLQPIRDLFLFIQIIFERSTGYNIEILSNFIFFTLSLLNLKSFIKNNHFFIFIIITLLHPTVVHIISLDASFKHILSFYFISYYIKINHRTELNRISDHIVSIFFLVLSLFTQPIFLFAPLFSFLSYKNDILSKLKKFFIHFLISFFVALFNKYYYLFIYPILTGSQKYVTDNIYSKLLSLGRFSAQIFTPINSYHFYSSDSLLNIIGIVIATFIILYFFKLNKKQLLHPFNLFIFLPILIINFDSTIIFFMDVYSLSAIVFISIYLARILNSNRKFLSIIILYSALNSYKILEKTNPNKFFHNSFIREPSCRNADFLIRRSINLGNFELLSYLVDWKHCLSHHPENRLREINAFLIYSDTKLNTNEKIEFFKKNSENKLSSIFLAILYAEINSMEKFLKEKEKLIAYGNIESRYYSISKLLIKKCKKNKYKCLDIKKKIPKEAVSIYKLTPIGIGLLVKRNPRVNYY